MSRPICQQCGYILQRCICDLLIPSIDNKIHIIVVRDKSEVHHAKNTASLLPLVLENVSIYDGSIEQLKQILTNEQLAQAALLYPDDSALLLESAPAKTLEHLKSLIVLDGSWKKAYKIYQSLPALHSLAKVSFASPMKTRYKIRATNLEHSLSTFEATVLALNLLEKIESKTALGFFDAFIERQLSLMPQNVRSFYLGNGRD